MAHTVIHHQRPDGDFGSHRFHIMGPRTSEAVEHLITKSSASVEQTLINGSNDDYALCLIATTDQADDVACLMYLKIWDGADEYILKHYDAKGTLIL